MKMLKSLTFFCLLIALTANTILAQESIRFEHLKYDEIIEKSKREKKPVMIYFTGTGCYLCVKMEKNVFPKTEVSKFYNNNFIAVESFDDSRKPDSATRQLRRRYGIISNPTFIFTDSTGSVIHKSGYKETEQFLLVGKQAISNDNYKTWKAQIDAGNLTASLMLKYLSAEQKPLLFSETNYACDAQVRLDKYFSMVTEKEYTNPDNWAIISNYVANPYSTVFKSLLNREKDFARAYGSKEVNEVIFKIFTDAWSGSKESVTYKKAESYIRSLNHPLAKLLVLQRDYLHQSNTVLNTLLTNPEKANIYTQEYDKYVTQYAYLFNIYAVNDVANTIMDQLKDNTSYISKAKKWMNLLLAIPGNEDYDFCATYAKACFLTKDYNNAVQAQEKALTLAIKDELDQDELKVYRKDLARYKEALQRK